MPLRLNMDESSVKMWPGARAGCVVPPAGAGRQAPRPEQAVPLSARRCAVTFVAFLCDDDEVQPLLPQFVVANKRLIPEIVARHWPAGGHEPVRLLRRQSAWLNGPVLQAIIREVAASLRPRVAGRRVILSMDACPVHLCTGVLRTVARCGMHFLPLAAQMTKYLQPADVGAFLPLKQRYQTLYEREQLLESRGVLPPGRALRLLAQAAQETIVTSSWRETFRRCGLSPEPPCSARFLAALGPEPLPAIEAVLPSLADLELILPRRRMVPVADLFPLLLRPERLDPVRPPRQQERRLPDPPRVPITRRASAALQCGSQDTDTAPCPSAPGPRGPSSAAPRPGPLRVPIGRRLLPWRPPPMMEPPPPWQ